MSDRHFKTSYTELSKFRPFYSGAQYPSLKKHIPSGARPTCLDFHSTSLKLGQII